MKEKSVFIGLLAAVLSVVMMAAVQPSQPGKVRGNSEADRAQRGINISPVRLNLRGKSRIQVGLGSYIVNAQGGCNDCHTNPPFAPGGDPFLGEPIQINTERFLAGGREFGPGVVSANITPDEDGKPAGLTFQEFRTLIRTGHEPDEPDEILQVMPWPIFRNMTDADLKAVYEYLSAIPHVDD